MAQSWYSPISINSAQVPSTQTDFPVLVSQTDARFKTIGNSGHVANASGFDIRPYTDSTLNTPITGYELERYNASTGEVVMWVKVSSLSSSTTPFVLGYGDASLTTDGSSTTTWSNSFLGVYHLKDGTTLSVNSSTGSNNGTNNGATAAAGTIDGGAGFVSASSQYIDLGTGMAPTLITMSAWVKATSFPNAYNSVITRFASGGTSYSAMLVKSTGKLAFFCDATSGDVSYDGTGSHTLSTATWTYLVLTYEQSSNIGLKGYVNAAQDGTTANSNFLTTTSATTDIGKDPINAGRFWNGVLDEVRVASVARSANWITTEYNNQNAPGTFETLGTEVAFIASSSDKFFMLF